MTDPPTDFPSPKDLPGSEAAPRQVKAKTLGWEAAQRRLRCGYTGAIADYMREHNLPQPKHILDVGCSARRGLPAALLRTPDGGMAAATFP